MSSSSLIDLPPIWSDDEIEESSNQTLHDQRRREVRSMVGDYIMGLRHNVSENSRRRRGGKRKAINRDREGNSPTLWRQYFADPGERIFDDAMFRRRFRMQRDLFLCIVGDVTQNDMYFTQRLDACNVLGLTLITKCTAAMRILGYGLVYDQVDEYLSVGETTTKDILRHFVEVVIDVYRYEYLMGPNPQDIARLKHVGAERGFPGMLGSVDWKNCPSAWKGKYMGIFKKASIILETVAFYDLCIWHAFFGVPRSCNDINVLDRSPLFDDVLNGVAPKCEFHVNVHDYNMGYYLTDGIYPEWAAFIPSVRLPLREKEKVFAKSQESLRKDVERAFRVLQAQFHIIHNPAYHWDIGMVGKIMIGCVILHNMIVEDERDTYGLHFEVSDFLDTPDLEDWEYIPGTRTDMTEFLQIRFQLHNRANH